MGRLFNPLIGVVPLMIQSIALIRPSTVGVRFVSIHESWWMDGGGVSPYRIVFRRIVWLLIVLLLYVYLVGWLSRAAPRRPRYRT